MLIELVVGQQATAAQTVTEAAQTYQRVLSSLGDDLQGQAAGFSGQAAAGFAEAVGAWFEVAVKLTPALEGYASALALLDRDHGRNDVEQANSYVHLSSRLGGQQP